MATIVTRAGKGSPLTNTEVDANFSNLNNDKIETNAEVRAAVEAASDSNVFTDADHTKLNAIEASADVTDTANVVAALTAGSNISIAADGTVAGSAAYSLPTSSSSTLGGVKVGANLAINGSGVLSATDTNTTYSVQDGGLSEINFTTADHTKLNAIEASADVTDTTNVVAALTAGSNITIASDGTIAGSAAFSLATASASTLGGVKVGANLAINGSGVLSATDTNTTYSVQDGGLSQNNFTNSDHTKLNGIATGATAYTSNQATNNNSNVQFNSILVAGAFTSSSNLALYTQAGDIDLKAIGGQVNILGTGGEQRILFDNAAVPTAQWFQNGNQTKLGVVNPTATRNINLPNASGTISLTDTTYSVGDGGLSEINFTSADHTKLNGITAGANFINNTNQLTNGAGFITSVPADITQTSVKFTTGPTLSEERDQNLKIKGHSHTDVGISGYDSSNNWRFQLYGSPGAYGFLDANWSNWDLRKATNGAMTFNGNDTYYLQPESTSNLNTLTVVGDSNLHGGGSHLGNHEFAATDTGTGYGTSSIELRESNYTATSSATPPRIGFHWGGVVASSIAMEADGTIAIRNNPGNAYEKFKCATINGRNTATDGSKLDGIAASANNYSFPFTISDAVSNSTVVKRTSGGYIFANYFYSTANDVSSGVTKVMVETGNDNYIRHGDANSIRGFMSLGTTSAVVFGSVTAATFTANSDINLKTNIAPIETPLAKVLAINGVTYDWKETGLPSVGVIAQDVEKVLPDAVHEDEKGTKSVNYNAIVGLLVETVKEQQKQIDALKTMVGK